MVDVTVKDGVDDGSGDADGDIFKPSSNETDNIELSNQINGTNRQTTIALWAENQDKKDEEVTITDVTTKTSTQQEIVTTTTTNSDELTTEPKVPNQTTAVELTTEPNSQSQTTRTTPKLTTESSIQSGTTTSIPSAVTSESTPSTRATTETTREVETTAGIALETTKRTEAPVVIPSKPAEVIPKYDVVTTEQSPGNGTLAGTGTTIAGLDAKTFYIVAGAAAGALLVLILIVLIVCCLKKKRRRSKRKNIPTIENPLYARRPNNAAGLRFSQDGAAFIAPEKRGHKSNNNQFDSPIYSKRKAPGTPRDITGESNHYAVSKPLYKMPSKNGADGETTAERKKRRAPPPPNPFTGELDENDSPYRPLRKSSEDLFERDDDHEQVPLTTFGRPTQFRSVDDDDYIADPDTLNSFKNPRYNGPSDDDAFHRESGDSDDEPADGRFDVGKAIDEALAYSRTPDKFDKSKNPFLADES